LTRLHCDGECNTVLALDRILISCFVLWNRTKSSSQRSNFASHKYIKVGTLGKTGTKGDFKGIANGIEQQRSGTLVIHLTNGYSLQMTVRNYLSVVESLDRV
jgi:hypothetical protein